ncbi:MAG: DUF2274 domain-containing protein [Xanthobacteraceae bacterium]
MTKLKLASVQDEKPVKLSVAVPAALHRDLVAYAEILSRESGKPIEASKLIAPMLEKFIASDREFAKARGAQGKPNPDPAAAKFDAVPPTSRAPD